MYGYAIDCGSAGTRRTSEDAPCACWRVHAHVLCCTAQFLSTYVHAHTQAELLGYPSSGDGSTKPIQHESNCLQILIPESFFSANETCFLELDVGSFAQQSAVWVSLLPLPPKERRSAVNGCLGSDSAAGQVLGMVVPPSLCRSTSSKHIIGVLPQFTSYRPQLVLTR